MMRTTLTKYYVGKNFAEPVKVNRSGDPNLAIATAVRHMQVDHYTDERGNPATAAEVYDGETGELHAALKRYGPGDIRSTGKRNLLKYETKIRAIGALFDKPKEE